MTKKQEWNVIIYLLLLGGAYFYCVNVKRNMQLCEREIIEIKGGGGQRGFTRNARGFAVLARCESEGVSLIGELEKSFIIDIEPFFLSRMLTAQSRIDL